jgi:hypothetical protein
MTETTPPYDRGHAFENDAEIHQLISYLLRGASRRQLWMFFLDENHVLVDPIMPLGDYPAEPSKVEPTPDLGSVDVATVLATRLRSVRDEVGAAMLVLVWERRGPDVFTVADVVWARAMATAFAFVEVDVRAQFVLHNRGVRQITADDYGATEAA